MPEATKEQVQTAEKPAAPAAPVLTDELFQDLKQNPTKFHDQPKAIQAEARRRLLESPDEGAGDKPVEKPVEKKDPPKEDPPPDEPKPLTQEQLAALRAEKKRLDDESNAMEQRLKSARERKERAEKATKEWAEKNPEKKVEDPLDEKNQLALLTEVRELRKEVTFLKEVHADRDREEVETLTRTHKETEETRIQKEIETLQADPKFAAIRTKKPVGVLNQEYAGWCDNLVALAGLSEDKLTADEKANPVQALRQRALERYESDPAFKESVKVAPPEELDKLKLILEGFQRKGQKGGTLRGHLFEILDDAGVLGAVMQRGRDEAARDAANKTAKSMKPDEITTLDPSDGRPRDSSSNEMTLEGAGAFMQYYKKKQIEDPRGITADDKKKLKAVSEFLLARG
jgi:hypothetical protein